MYNMQKIDLTYKGLRVISSLIITMFCLIFLGVNSCYAQENTSNKINVNTKLLELSNVQEFIDHMESKHSYPRAELEEIFSKVNFVPKVVQAVKAPAERFSWDKYKKIFLNKAKIEGGAAFWKKYSKDLDRAYETYGVNPEIIVAIIGVESMYGRYKGKFNVVNSLSTLAFGYTNRVKFFRSELENFLLLAKEQGFDVFNMKGSYAGAMGMPQFISSSWRHYAVDFSDIGNNDIISNPVNAIGSVANYFHKNGWKKGPIADRINLEGDNYKHLLSAKTRPTKPKLSIEDFNKAGLKIDKDINTKVALLAFNDDSDSSETEFWLGYNNFYTITRYNFSSNYAMAVYELSQSIKSEYEKEIK